MIEAFGEGQGEVLLYLGRPEAKLPMEWLRPRQCSKGQAGRHWRQIPLARESLLLQLLPRRFLPAPNQLAAATGSRCLPRHPTHARMSVPIRCYLRAARQGFDPELV